MSDVDTFLAFAGEGRYAKGDIPTVTDNRNRFDLGVGVYTYVTSKLMQETNYYTTPGKVVERTQFETDYCTLADNSSTCATEDGKFFYWSPATHRPYELRSKGKPVVGFEQLLGHFDENGGGWADMQLLFDGAWNCTGSGWAGGKVVNEQKNGMVDASCLSQLPVYYECGTACAVDVRAGGNCPFGFTRRC